VQYLGERPSLTDGGHGIGYWDHLIGRYLLTTPYPETALSFMKSHNVSYLLLDPTDIGKYSAYSSIASDNGGEDRLATIPNLFLDDSQTIETKDSITRIYSGASYTDEDIIYKYQEEEIFLPSGRTIMGGVVLKENKNSFEQPRVVFIYNQEQIFIPVRYLYIEGELIDFGGGLEATVRLFPVLEENENKIKVDPFGGMLYLSPKVHQSLFAQLYLLGDGFNNYPTLKLVYSKNDPYFTSIATQLNMEEDILYYQGLRGPIKIWKVSYPENIIEKEEFLRTSGEYAEFDNLIFKK
jgi:hypothetical protein